MYKVTVNKFDAMEGKFVNRKYLALVDNFEETAEILYGNTEQEIISSIKVDAEYYDREIDIDEVEYLFALKYMIVSVDEKGKLRKTPRLVYLPAGTTDEAEKAFWDEFMKNSVVDAVLCRNEKTDYLPIKRQ